jgi:hypothetical protein
VRRRGRARRLGDIISTLLIIVGAIGLVIYMLYVWNPSDAALRYALIALIIVGGLLAVILAALYLTGEVEQSRTRHEELRQWYLKYAPRVCC